MFILKKKTVMDFENYLQKEKRKADVNTSEKFFCTNTGDVRWKVSSVYKTFKDIGLVKWKIPRFPFSVGFFY